MKKFLGSFFLAAVLGAPAAHAAGYTTWAVPTGVEIVNGGVLISGAFGDPNSCGQPNYVFVSQSSTVYKDILAMSYMAFAAGREMSFYASACTQVGFHWAGSVINQNLDGQGALVR